MTFLNLVCCCWSMVKKAGKLVDIELRPHDRRRHAATYASRSGTPIEIIRDFPTNSPEMVRKEIVSINTIIHFLNTLDKNLS